MTEFDELEARAVSRLKEVAARPSPHAGRPNRSRRAALAALVLVVIAGSAAIAGMSQRTEGVEVSSGVGDPVVSTSTEHDPTGTFSELRHQYSALDYQNRPALVAPEGLPRGWSYLAVSGATATDGDAATLDISFARAIEGKEAFPTVTLRVIAVPNGADACGPPEDENICLPIAVPGFSGTAVLYGQRSVIDEWNSIAWTVDQRLVTW